MGFLISIFSGTVSPKTSLVGHYLPDAGFDFAQPATGPKVTAGRFHSVENAPLL
jgi:hypothetical protein